ncbi:MAG: hypothetical protein HZB13_09485 [Acidobacteria bacterium]|nr:hypothetical protein [Acidobacteriota bacterium]
MPFERELRVARDLAWRAGEVALRFQREGFEAEDKPDASPVTEADRECERVFVEGLAAAFPDDGLLGEEGARKESLSGRRWIIDPIDGTRDFMRLNRLWSSLIALEVDGEVKAGLATFPALEFQYWASAGQGAWRYGDAAVTRMSCSRVDDVSRAVLCYNQFNHVLDRPHPERVLPFAARFWAVRCLGGALDAMFVASGSAEMWIEPSAKPWDLAALSLIAKEAGCRYFDYTGVDTIYGGNAVICTPAMEPAAREFLGI